MNTHTFDNHYVTCPICQRYGRGKQIKSYIGLYSCPYCQERLVVCQSGHYVRDPFTLNQIMICSALRRQSSPISRIIRDFILFKRPLLAFVVGSAVFLGMISMTQQGTSSNQQPPGTEEVR
ncbi:hypothetical protein [Anabaena azotica]|uniref:Transposase zinc-ribbon domain-containing protein n=1 Tax=Anabaena azotica FACHB-119 TaxID=947527 RepID=A0ABR8DDC6_9NOST|nr:hypothetical protein [Anabaena azotica]MBD2505202.1 hypothetical protein [Anabaena azotica FACHB-119]